MHMPGMLWQGMPFVKADNRVQAAKDDFVARNKISADEVRSFSAVGANTRETFSPATVCLQLLPADACLLCAAIMVR